jgi:hypothetical protein
MKHYDFAEKLRPLWDKACRLYTTGQRDAASYFTADEPAFLAANGITAQHLYDYAEDFTSGGEPTWHTALAIELVRRDCFLNAQNGRASTTVRELTPGTGRPPGRRTIPCLSLTPKRAAGAGARPSAAARVTAWVAPTCPGRLSRPVASSASRSR